MKKILFIPDDYSETIKADNSQFVLLEKGKLLSEFDGFGDGFLLDYNEDSGFNLYACLNKITSAELSQFENLSSFEIAFTEIEDCGFLCFKFGNLPWSDANFEPRLYSYPLSYPIIDPTSSVGIALNVVVIDPHQQGIIKSIRLIGLGHDFSVKFIEWCINHYNTKTSDFSAEIYDYKRNAVYQRYSTRELVEKALFKWKMNNCGENKERKAIEHNVER